MMRDEFRKIMRGYNAVLRRAEEILAKRGGGETRAHVARLKGDEVEIEYFFRWGAVWERDSAEVPVSEFVEDAKK